MMMIAASSMLTPLGNNPARVHCAVEAGINRYRQSDILSSDGEPIIMALVPREATANALDYNNLSGDLNARQKRLLRLAVVALNSLKPHLPDEMLPLFVAGPESHRNSAGLSHRFINSLSQQCDVPIDTAYSRAIHSGRSGALEMVQMAERYFASTDAHYALVGGVDSYYHVATLDQLDDQHRLLSAKRPEGFVPAEGAGFILLISPKAPHAIQKNAIAQLNSPVMACENGHITSELPFRGDALTDIFAQLTASPKKPVSTLYSSANGEKYYAAELGIAMLRYSDYFDDNKKIVRPAEYLGDIGAAFGTVMMGLAAQQVCEQQKLNQTQKKSTLVYCSSDSGARAGLCVSSIQHIKAAKNTQQSESV